MLTTVPFYVYSSGKEQDIELLRLCQQQPGLAWCGAGRLVPLVQQDPDREEHHGGQDGGGEGELRAVSNIHSIIVLSGTSTGPHSAALLD